MLNSFSVLLLAGVTMVGRATSAQACAGCAGGAANTGQAPAVAAKVIPRAPAATAQNGRQTIRRYSVAPGAAYRPAATVRPRRYSRGPSYNATRKVLGY